MTGIAQNLSHGYLLNVQGAHRAFQRVVVRVSVRPSKAVPVEVLCGKQVLKPLFLVEATIWGWSVLPLRHLQGGLL